MSPAFVLQSRVVQVNTLTGKLFETQFEENGAMKLSVFMQFFTLRDQVVHVDTVPVPSLACCLRCLCLP